MDGLHFFATASGHQNWDGAVRMNVSTFVGKKIVSGADFNLSVKEAKRLINELVGAVNEVQSREWN